VLQLVNKFHTFSTELTNEMQQLLKFITCRLDTAKHVSGTTDPNTGRVGTGLSVLWVKCFECWKAGTKKQMHMQET
jgi:hypothetical protein